MTNLARFRFFGSLETLLVRSYRASPISYRFNEHPGVKDAIEVMGVPHTEVDVIVVGGCSVGFDYQLQDQDQIEVYPVYSAVSVGSILHLTPLISPPPRFILDDHLGKLARRLRLLGFDCLYRIDFSDDEIVRLALAEGRVILTRDRGILKQRRVDKGYLVNSDYVEVQLQMTLERYRCFDLIEPLRRCAICNGLTEAVDKTAIQHRLLPKTARYYETFHRCRECRQLYWQGSHYARLKCWINGVIAGQL